MASRCALYAYAHMQIYIYAYADMQICRYALYYMNKKLTSTVKLSYFVLLSRQDSIAAKMRSSAVDKTARVTTRSVIVVDQLTLTVSFT